MSKRTPKRPAKYEDAVLQEQSTSKKWCTLVCLEDNKVYTAPAKGLEFDNGMQLTDDDLTIGNSVVWHHRGLPYVAEILKIHDKKPMPEEKLSAYRSIGKGKAKGADVSAVNKKGSQGREKSPVQESSSNSSPESKTTESDAAIKSVSTKTSLAQKLTALGAPIQSNTDHDSKDDPSSLRDQLELLQAGQEKIAQDVHKIVDFLQIPQDTTSNRQLVKIQSIIKSKSNTDDLSTVKSKPSTDDSKYISDNGVALLEIKSSNPEKYALALLSALFSDEELATSCYAETSRSKKPALPQEDIQLLEECVDIKFGKGTMIKQGQTIRRKCNQKCIDLNKKLPVATDKD